jgi:hypothetical protein
VKLFDDIQRADTSPALFSESSYQFLNRVAGAPWDKVRALLEAWFVDHPANVKHDLYNRFTDIDDGQHLGAWWELYIASLFRLLGYEVAAHPTVEGSNRQPDFLISRASTSFYVECTVASAGGGAGTRGTTEWIYDCINDVENRDFLIGIHHITQGTQQPKRIEVTRPIAQWLAELDPDALVAAPYDQLPRKTITIRGWVITYVAVPKRVEARDKGGGLIAFLSPVFGFPIDDVDRFHEALSKKGRRYGREPLPLPLIVAVLTTSGFVDEDHVTDALFGRKAFEWHRGDPDSIRMVRKRNGYWRGDWSADDAQRGTRVSAALFGPNIRCDRVAAKLPQLWTNPWAAIPLNRYDGFTTTTEEDSGEITREEGTLNASTVFALDPDWPFFPNRWS